MYIHVAIMACEKLFVTQKLFVFIGHVPVLPPHTSIILTRLFRTRLGTGGRALFPVRRWMPSTEHRADSEGFRRIETRAKSNLVVLPFKLEPFNRRRSVRDRAARHCYFELNICRFMSRRISSAVDEERPASGISSYISTGLRGSDFLPRFED